MSLPLNMDPLGQPASAQEPLAHCSGGKLGPAEAPLPGNSVPCLNRSVFWSGSTRRRALSSPWGPLLVLAHKKSSLLNFQGFCELVDVLVP